MFKVRKTHCSFNKTVYDEDKDSFKCQGSINVYHCIQNERNRSGEICIQPVWVQANYCPEYNSGANTLDTVPCNAPAGSCPDALFLSNEVYKYPVCLNKTFTDDGTVLKENSPLPSPWTIALIGVSSVILIVAVLCGVRRFLRKKSIKTKDEASYHLLSEKNELFHKTAAFHEGVKFINSGGKLLCLIGRWGSGKTTTAKQVYTEVSHIPPLIVRDLSQFEVCDKPVILDDAFNKRILDLEKEQFREKITKMFEKMLHCATNLFIILTIDDETVSDYIKSLVSSEDEMKFIDVSKSLTTGDRTQILSSQFRTLCPGKDFSKVERLALKGKDHSLGYPEICALFCRCSEFQNVGPAVFCNRPLYYLKSHLEQMYKSKDKSKFLMLVFMSLNEMKINLNDSNNMLYDLLESCTHNKIRTSSSLENIYPVETKMLESSDTEALEATSSMAEQIRYDRSKKFLVSLIPTEFVVKEAKENIYRLQHHVIKRITLIVFGNNDFEKLLKFSKREDLQGWIEESGVFSVSNPLTELNPVLSIKGDQWKQYQLKMKESDSETEL